MPTRNISLTPAQDAFVDDVIERGEYQNASEAIRDAIRALQQRRREDALKLAVLRKELAVGADALDRGDYDDMSVADVGRYLDDLLTPGKGRRRRVRGR